MIKKLRFEEFSMEPCFVVKGFQEEKKFFSQFLSSVSSQFSVQTILPYIFWQWNIFLGYPICSGKHILTIFLKFLLSFFCIFHKCFIKVKKNINSSPPPPKLNYFMSDIKFYIIGLYFWSYFINLYDISVRLLHNFNIWWNLYI